MTYNDAFNDGFDQALEEIFEDACESDTGFPSRFENTEATNIRKDHSYYSPTYYSSSACNILDRGGRKYPGGSARGYNDPINYSRANAVTMGNGSTRGTMNGDDAATMKKIRAKAEEAYMYRKGYEDAMEEYIF